MVSTERFRLPLLHEVVNLGKIRRYVERLSLREVMKLLDRDFIVHSDGTIFEVHKIRIDKIPVSLVKIFVECPWSIITGLRIGEEFHDSGMFYMPMNNIRVVYYGRLIHEIYLNYLENNLNIPVEVEVETEVTVNGRLVKLIGRVDALVPEYSKIAVLEVKTGPRLLPSHHVQAWTYAHMLERTINEKMFRPVFITPRGVERPDRYHPWREILEIVRTIVTIVESRGDMPWSRAKTCTRTRCPYYRWCPKAIRPS